MDRLTIAVTGQYERTGAGVGAAPVQWSYGVQVSGTPTFIFGERLRIEAAAERLGGAFAATQAMTIRAGAELTLPLRTVIQAGVERNPWILPAAGGRAWMFIFGVSRSFDLPRRSGHGTRGRVFRDLNGNGRADEGEPGFGGVVLRRGTEVAVSDSRGAFTLAGNERDAYEIDARSFPIGWLTPSTIIPGGTREIAAIAVTPVMVVLALDAADSARVPPGELARITVTARDSKGRQWISRRTSDSTLAFDALPPGTYTVELDLSAASEPLRLAGASPTIVVESGRATPPLRISLSGRQLRFSNQRRGAP
jgi:hypothetical protein